MSHLAPDFDPDVFVSYAYGGQIHGSAPLRDWTQALIRRLRDRLHALETEFDDLDLWMDPEVDPTADLTPVLREKAVRCGALMIVMSKRYLKSDWCEKEREWFRQQIDSRAPHAGRVFLLQAQKTDCRLWPAFLLDAPGQPRMKGFTFFDPKDGSPLGFQLREPPDEYYKELAVLQTWLVARLRELRDRAAKSRTSAEGAASVAGAAPAPPQRRIYLHAPPECELVRAEVGLALKSDGFIPIAQSVGAGRRLADWQREAMQLRLEAGKHCEALALLRADEGEDRFVSDLLDIGVDERERIATSRGAPLPCAVLDKTGGGLPIDVSWAGIERFDLRQTDWLGRFRSWLDASRISARGAAS